MSDTVISVENLSKRYVIAHLADRAGRGDRDYSTMRDLLANAMKAPLRSLRTRLRLSHHVNGPSRSEGGASAPAPEPSAEEFWALKDVDFAIKRGEVLGIIGRNGAGKSTLLKILSRITEPTSGRVRIKGRVASLLEVGTGFHPELTGRENIFLNGAILGMTRSEIRSKFDEIVSFAEVERFLDTPVKRYSSGMYVRLAFAVAAHLEPEVLIVDEVLAVGDASFQTKCLGKMQEATAGGERTVIFVSHNLGAVQRLCSKGLYLRDGKVAHAGAIGKVLDQYQRSFDQAVPTHERSEIKAGQIRFVSWEIKESATELPHACLTREICTFKVVLVSRRKLADAYLSFIIWNTQGEVVLAANSKASGLPLLTVHEGLLSFFIRVRLPLKPSLYQIDVRLNSIALGYIEGGVIEPRLNILPQEEMLEEKWQGIISETVTFEFENGV
jgi:lipopolysaccharide transport system ATP-binding protein